MGRDERTRASEGEELRPVPAPPSASARLHTLLETLGRHLEDHAPEDLLLLLREEMERREFDAYASGWRDAAEQYESALERVRAAGGPGVPLPGGRTPGQAAVIPFPRDHPQAPERRSPDRRGLPDRWSAQNRWETGRHDPDHLDHHHDPDHLDHRLDPDHLDHHHDGRRDRDHDSGGDHDTCRPGGGRDERPDPPDGGGSRSAARGEPGSGPPSEPLKPAFGHKRRSSKVPTIPSLPPPRLGRRDPPVLPPDDRA